MKLWFRGKRGGALAFAIIALLVIGGLGWLTAQTLRMEQDADQTRRQKQAAEEQRQREKDFDHRVQLALTLLDGRVLPVLIQEQSRPFEHYSAVFASSRSLTRVNGDWKPETVLEPSPLLVADVPDWIVVHFQSTGESSWKSPQIPSDNLRKNLVRLLRAFNLLRRQGFASHVLAFVGSRGWKDSEILATAEQLGLDGAVRMLGRVHTDDLVALYNLADLLAFPSLYEGFGLPVIEAMACGTPVVASPNGSLAEIAGSAAEFVDPTQVESIAAGLYAVLSDAERRAELRVAGLEQAARFSWETTASQTREVYEAVLR